MRKFDALNAHVHWVYVAYILLLELPLDEDVGIKERQRFIRDQIEAKRNKNIIQLVSRINGREEVISKCREVIHELEAA